MTIAAAYKVALKLFQKREKMFLRVTVRPYCDSLAMGAAALGPAVAEDLSALSSSD